MTVVTTSVPSPPVSTPSTQPPTSQPAWAAALGASIFVMRKRIPGESHLVKPTVALVPEPGIVCAQNLDGSVNAVVFAADGSMHTVLGIKTGDSTKPAPWFSTTAPAASKPATVVTK